MDLEVKTFPLFTPLDNSDFDRYLGHTPTLIGAFSTTPDTEP